MSMFSSMFLSVFALRMSFASIFNKFHYFNMFKFMEFNISTAKSASFSSIVSMERKLLCKLNRV